MTPGYKVVAGKLDENFNHFLKNVGPVLMNIIE